MRKTMNRMNGKQLAEALPIIYDMVNKGVNKYNIAHKFNLSHITVEKYYVSYQRYLNGKTDARIQRAIPYLIVQQSKIKFIEERKLQPAPKEQFNKPFHKQKQIQLLWGFIKINW